MPGRRKVLIVDDDPPLRWFFRTALTQAGFEVREVSNGYDALQAVEDHLPDLVVLDLGLPVVSGRMVAEELAAQVHTRDIPVVVVTGEPDVEVKTVVGADCVLTKPVTAEKLIDTVQRCLATKR